MRTNTKRNFYYKHIYCFVVICYVVSNSMQAVAYKDQLQNEPFYFE